MGASKLSLTAAGDLSRGEGMSACQERFTALGSVLWGCLLIAAKVQHKITSVSKSSWMTLCPGKVLRNRARSHLGRKAQVSGAAKVCPHTNALSSSEGTAEPLREAATSSEMAKDVQTKNPSRHG